MHYNSKRPLPAVSAVVFNAEKKVLLTLRSLKVRWPGYWCLPGGHVDGGQDWLTACRIELQEEVGLVMKESKLVGMYSDPTINKMKDPKSGEDLYYVVASFLISKYEGEVQCNDEVEKWGWFNVDELPEPLLPPEKIKILDAAAFQGRAFVR